MTDLSALTAAFAQLATATESALTAVSVRPPVTVKDYGAKGDGTTDDTAALRTALASGVAIVPPGTYLTAPLLIPRGAVLQGVNGQAYYNATPTIPSLLTLSRLKLKPGSTKPLLSPDDSASKATSVLVRDLNLDCSGIAQPAINLPDQAASISRFWRMDRVYVCNVGGSTGFAVYIGNQNSGCFMRDCVVFNGTSGSPAGANGIGWYGPDGLLDNSFIGYFGGTGLTIMGGASDPTFTMRGGGSFTNKTGIVVGGMGAIIDGVSIDHNLNDGIYIGFGPTLLSGCTFHSNSLAQSNNWSHIAINADVTVSMMGCRAAPLDIEANGKLPKYMINTFGRAGVTLNQFGCAADAGVTFGTGWTDYAR